MSNVVNLKEYREAKERARLDEWAKKYPIEQTKINTAQAQAQASDASKMLKNEGWK